MLFVVLLSGDVRTCARWVIRSQCASVCLLFSSLLFYSLLFSSRLIFTKGRRGWARRRPEDEEERRKYKGRCTGSKNGRWESEDGWLEHLQNRIEEEGNCIVSWLASWDHGIIPSCCVTRRICSTTIPCAPHSSGLSADHREAGVKKDVLGTSPGRRNRKACRITLSPKLSENGNAGSTRWKRPREGPVQNKNVAHEQCN